MATDETGVTLDWGLQINDPVRNAQEAFQMEVHAARVVR
jgi:hypothetical protein